MNFIEKNGLYVKLQKGLNPEADAELLKVKNPAAPSLTSHHFNNERRNKEILLDLIDYASYDEIVSNRKKFLEKKKEKEQPVDLEKLTKKQLIEQYGDELEISEKDNKADIIGVIEEQAKKKDYGEDTQKNHPDQDDQEMEADNPNLNPEDSSPEAESNQNEQ
ncbi:MAG: hypothetical protein ACOC59_00240 [Bacteroidota bacterium]